jgi:hypothetical protein
MATISKSRRPVPRRITPGPPPSGRRRRHYGPILAAFGLLVLLAVLVAGAVVVATSKPGLSSDSQGLARISLPVGGGRILAVSVTVGPHSDSVPVRVQGNRITPARSVQAGAHLTVDVTVARPGWISWLTGKRESLHLQLTAPTTRLTSHFLTLAAGEPLRVSFRNPVSTISYGTAGHMKSVVLTAQSSVELPRPALAGTMLIAAAPRTWERGATRSVSWFPAGARGSAVASPAPGSAIKPTTPITLTFNKPVSQILGGALPAVSPAGAGSWHTLSSHAIQFTPSAYGYGVGATVTVGLPHGITVVGGAAGADAPARWHVPQGSTLRLQQLLALLGYLPVGFSYSGPGVGRTPSAEESAAINPPAGSFSWRYPNTPPQLRALWAPGQYGTVTRGAVMAFEDDHGLAADGDAGPQVWRALIGAALAGQRSSSGYTFVLVDKEASPQHLVLWHDGSSPVHTVVNTGIPQAPTANGVYPVYEHLRVTTMSGKNPDGSTYHDPGIQFVSYFNGGDALHAFTRAQYGYPQSLGCVEMPLSAAGQVWPYTPIGTLVDVG